MAAAHKTDQGFPQNEYLRIENGEPVLSPVRGKADPEGLKGFLKAMTGVSLPLAHAIAQRFPWRQFRSFVDVGCAQGGASAVVAEAHPHLMGIGFDLPPVGPVFEAYVAERGLAEGCISGRAISSRIRCRRRK